MRRNLRRCCHDVITWVPVFLLCFYLTGCGPEWKRKFVRKRAERKVEPIFIYEPQVYQRESNDILYKRHFAFWKAWQEELVNKLGSSRISDLRSFEEALKSLNEMKDCLNEEKAIEIEGYIKKMEAFYNHYKLKEFDIIRSMQMRRDLDKVMLKVDKVFRYNRVKEFITTN